MKSLRFFLPLLVLFTTACGPTDAPDVKVAGVSAGAASEIPRLLDRAESLRHGKEWDHVQNYYGTHAAELRANPRNWEARLRLAEVFIQEARVTGEHPHYYPAALSVIAPVVAAFEAKAALDPREKDVYFRALSHQAGVQLSLHDFTAARQTAEKAVAINPYNAYIYGCLVDASVELGQYDRAVQYCDKMVSIRPDLRSYARVSYLRELHGDIDGAIEAMNMAVQAGYPGSEQTEWTRLQLGDLCARYGRLRDAEAHYQTCLAARPDYPFALGALATLRDADGQAGEAETLWKKAAGIVPEVGFYVDLAKLYRKTGREAEAAALVADVERMLAEDTEAGHNMRMEIARFHLDVTGRLDEALRQAEAEYAVRPENIAVNQLLAAIWVAQGQPDRARPFAEKAARTGCREPELVALKKQL